MLLEVLPFYWLLYFGNLSNSFPFLTYQNNRRNPVFMLHTPVQLILMMAIASMITVVCIIMEKAITVMPVASFLFYGKRYN